MIQNIKTDIIYYKTATDFEMEFNLCGCCRMRLLTDKAAERKSLVANLSRAVSRSRIIMVVGPLFGDDNIVSNIATVIGKKLVAADNKTYGINSSDEIEIIDNSTPLVTEDGIYGGCIIESGPQTMILLSESKNIRKSIMNNLIHPYIEEVYAAGVKEEVAEEHNEPIEEEAADTAEETEIITEAQTEAVAEETEEAVTEITEEQAEEIFGESSDIIMTDETVCEASREPENETVTEDVSVRKDASANSENDLILDDCFEPEAEAPADAEQGEDIELFAEPKRIRRKEAKFYNEAYGDFNLDDAGLIDDNDYDYEYDKAFYRSFSFSKIAVWVLTILILVALVVLCYAIFYVPSKEGVSSGEYIRDIFNTLFG